MVPQKPQHLDRLLDERHGNDMHVPNAHDITYLSQGPDYSDVALILVGMLVLECNKLYSTIVLSHLFRRLLKLLLPLPPLMMLLLLLTTIAAVAVAAAAAAAAAAVTAAAIIATATT